MKGTIFTTFESFVVDSFGEDVYDDIVDAAELETTEPFVGPGTYPASDMMALVASACARLDLTADDALAAFGRYAFPKLAAAVPELMAGIDDARSFFESLESVIHTEVRKLYPDAEPARFASEVTGPQTMLLHYRSPLGLHALVGGFIDAVGTWYDESIVHEVVATEGTNATFALVFAEATTADDQPGRPISSDAR